MKLTRAVPCTPLCPSEQAESVALLEQKVRYESAQQGLQAEVTRLQQLAKQGNDRSAKLRLQYER